jgi:hypothetical protein
MGGYGVIQAEGKSEALERPLDHPFLAPGCECTIDTFLPNK